MNKYKKPELQIDTILIEDILIKSASDSIVDMDIFPDEIV